MAFGYLTPYRGALAPRSTGTGGSLFDLSRQMNRLFDDLFEQGGGNGLTARTGIAAPAIDIHQRDGKLEITAELPGVKEEDIDITIDDGVLSLRGEKKSTHEDQESGYFERSYGSFERRVTLPSDVDEDNCSADFRDGVLTVTLPRSEEKARGRKIPLGQGKSRGNRAEDALIEQRAEKGAKQGERQRENA